MRRTRIALSAAFAVSLGACSTTTPPEQTGIHPGIWPKGQSGVARNPGVEAEVTRLVAQMTLEEKVGQTIQPDIGSVSPADVRKYHIGSILNGGGSGPYGDDRALAPQWLKAADDFYAASLPETPDRPKIPLIWGSDSVHGNSNIIGATIFPHNIGLGAARDPGLLREIGKITAVETRVVGADWTFAPTIAVVRDDRWGRTFEGYSEDPGIVRDYAGAIVEGIQGKPSDADFLTGPHIIATAKHFIGDGGTDKGHDQGDNLYSEEDLRDIFSPGYQTAIAAGVQTVMASFSSWQGQKMHGDKALLDDVLVGRLGLDGFVVGDWNGYAQVPGCSVAGCAAAYNAGVDMIMAPDHWRQLYDATLAQARSGEIPAARLDEAVSRILRVKLRAGVMDEGPPSARPYGGKWDELGAPEHRAVARRAVRESLVLLKNDGGLLPLKPNLRVLVAGDGANDLGKQCGGWTISWQGTGNVRSDFPNGQTIFEGIQQKVNAAGGSANLSADGSFTDKPDVAIVVFGEDPYAEFAGDRENLAYQPGDPRDLHILQALRAKGIPVAAVFLSGRPLYVTREINASNAFVAAWLPGSEGGGVADLLFRDADGAAAYDFRGKLSYSWPRAPDQTPLNVPRKTSTFDFLDKSYDPLFAFGYGMDYANPHDLGALPEASADKLAAANVDTYLRAGHSAPPWSLALTGADGVAVSAERVPAQTGGGTLSVARVDRKAQEDTLVATWSGSAKLSISGPPVDLSRQTNGDMSLRLELRIDAAPVGSVMLGINGHAIDVTALLRGAAGKGWTNVDVRLSCLKAAGADMSAVAVPFELSSASAFAVSIGSVTLAPGEGPPACPAPAPQT